MIRRELQAHGMYSDKGVTRRKFSPLPALAGCDCSTTTAAYILSRQYFCSISDDREMTADMHTENRHRAYGSNLVLWIPRVVVGG